MMMYYLEKYGCEYLPNEFQVIHRDIRPNKLLIERKYKSEEIFKNLLSYYVQSDFPRKLINKVDNEVLIKFIDDRIRCLDFCEKAI